MRELDRCDFCEEPADGVYEVVPETATRGARRLVLCTACRDTLAGVVDPLLDALDDHDHADHDPSPAVTVEPAVPDVEMNDEDDETGGEAEDENVGDVRADADEADATDPDTLDAESDDGNDAGDTSDGANDANDADEADDDASDETDATPDRPRGYAQLVRLLRNRPGAMTRADLAELADGAYDLSRHDVEVAVDAAVENGHLEETPEGVRTP